MAFLFRAFKKLNQLRRKLRPAKVKAVDAIQEQGRSELQVIAVRFDRETYTNLQQTVTKLKAFGKAWARRKLLRNYDTRRGHAKGAFERGITSANVYKKTKQGFEYNFTKMKTFSFFTKKRSGLVVRVNARNYARKYIRTKAPGFGTLSKNQVARIQRKASEAMPQVLLSIPDTRRVGRTKVTLQLILDNPLQK